MNSKERIFAALERKEPDRVPLLEWSIDQKVIETLSPGSTYFDFLDKIGMDGVSLGYGHTFSGHDGEVKFQTTFQDKWGVARVWTGEAISYPLKGPIKSEEDLRSYAPPDPNAPDALGNFPQLVQRFKGDKAIIWENRDVLSNPRYLRGTEDFLVDLIDNPNFAHEVIEMALAYEIEMAKKAIKAGAEVVMLGDDYAYNSGPLMSPEHFRVFVFPRLKRIVRAIHEMGAYCAKHSDGNIMKILDMIIESGVDGINPIDPIAGLDIGVIKRLYGNRVCVIDNIDCGHLLTNCILERVIRAVKDCFRDCRISPNVVILGNSHVVKSITCISKSNLI